MSDFFVGVDLGKSHDFSALAVVESTSVKGAWDPANWCYKMLPQRSVRHLERIPLGTPYTEVVRQIADLLRSPALVGRCTLAVDATGLGAPVVDSLKALRLRAALMPVILTGGELESCRDGYFMVPKRDIIMGLELLTERDELIISEDLEERPAFMRELEAMEVKIGASGRDSYGAMRAGAHDDLVIAVGLACWAMGKHRGTFGEQPFRLL